MDQFTQRKIPFVPGSRPLQADLEYQTSLLLLCHPVGTTTWSNTSAFCPSHCYFQNAL